MTQITLLTYKEKPLARWFRYISLFVSIIILNYKKYNNFSHKWDPAPFGVSLPFKIQISFPW